MVCCECCVALQAMAGREAVDVIAAAVGAAGGYSTVCLSCGSVNVYSRVIRPVQPLQCAGPTLGSIGVGC